MVLDLFIQKSDKNGHDMCDIKNLVANKKKLDIILYIDFFFR